MNPATDKIIPRHLGRFQITPVGRVGTYEAAKRARRCRARKYWVIEEELPEVKITTGTTDTGLQWESRRKHEEREDFGRFKTKTLAIQFMIDYAKANPRVTIEGDITGYPRLIIPCKRVE